MYKEIDFEKLTVKYKVGEDKSIIAEIRHYVGDNWGKINLMSDHEYTLYWDNLTARYYAVPTRTADNQQSQWQIKD